MRGIGSRKDTVRAMSATPDDPFAGLAEEARLARAIPELDLLDSRLPDVAELERLLQTRLPPVGATALSGRVTWAGGRLNIADLRGVMGKSTLEGELAFDLRGAKPRMTGTLRMLVLDMQPFIGTAPDVPAALFHDLSDFAGRVVLDPARSVEDHHRPLPGPRNQPPAPGRTSFARARAAASRENAAPCSWL